jgi:hypothetical protein
VLDLQKGSRQQLTSLLRIADRGLNARIAIAESEIHNPK